MRRGLSRLLGVVAAACACAAAAQTETEWTCPDGFQGQTLSVWNWTTYVAEDTISNFERLCGVRVIYDTYATDDDMLVRLRQGNPGFDVVVPSDLVASLIVAEGLAVELDHELIPNLVNVDPKFLDQPFDPGNRYTVPYQWGTTGIGFNRERVGEVTSWRDVFEHDGPVAWINVPTSMIGAALLMLGLDPTSSDPADIDAAKRYLIENGGNVVYVHSDDGQELLARGEVDIVVEYNGDVFQVMDECGCDTFGFVIPDEGTLYGLDSLVIPRGAPNPVLAHAFIDYVLDAHVGASVSNYTAYGSPNRAAIERGLIDEELLTDEGIYPSEEVMARMYIAKQDDVREALLNEAWDEVRVFVGQ